ncbi:MAG: glycosyltransferase [Thermoproteota archaeon]
MGVKVMKVTYVALEPLKYPRIRKIAHTLKNYHGIEFSIMIPKVRVLLVGGIIKRILSALINYIAIILQIFFTKSDVFWVANCPDILVVPLVLRRKRYILEYRSPWAIEVTEEFGEGPWFYISRFFEQLALKHAWIITLTTSKLYERVKGFGKPTFIIPNYPLKSFGDEIVPKEIFRIQHGCNEESKIVLFVGKLSRVEGADLLPKIMEKVLREEENAVFWIIGDGPLFPQLRDFAKRFPGKVILFGWQAHTRIPNFIAAADVCIAPRHASIHSALYNEEGLHKISEYMFFKKPIVACGIARSSEYLLVNEDEMADGILMALRGLVPPSKRKTWEDYSEKKIHEMFNLIFSGKI